MTYIDIRFLKNRQIEVGNGQQFHIPIRMERSEDPMCETRVPTFVMDTVFRVELQDEAVQLPEREEGMPKRLHDDLVTEAWNEVAKARAQNAVVRKRLQAFVESGTIEVIEDSGAVKVKKPEAKSSK